MSIIPKAPKTPKRITTYQAKYCGFCCRYESPLYQYEDNKKEWFCSRGCHDNQKTSLKWKGSRAKKWK